MIKITLKEAKIQKLLKQGYVIAFVYGHNSRTILRKGKRYVRVRNSGAVVPIH